MTRDFYPPSMLRIEVEGIKHSIVHHLLGATEEFNQIIAEEIEACDVAAMVRNQIRYQAPLIVKNAVQEAGEQIAKKIARTLVEEIDDQVWEAAIKRRTERQ